MAETIEQKYNEALKKGRQILNTPYTAHWDVMKECIEHILPELSESEDEKKLRILMNHFKQWEILEGYTEETRAWISGLISKQKPVEWSEEDEKVVSQILCLCGDFIRSYQMCPSIYKVVQNDIDKISYWLKSLKYRVMSQPNQESTNECLKKMIEYDTGRNECY